MEGDSEESGESEARFAAYVESLASVLGNVDRVALLNDYCTGLLMPGERKTFIMLSPSLNFSRRTSRCLCGRAAATATISRWLTIRNFVFAPARISRACLRALNPGRDRGAGGRASRRSRLRR